jgi:hypothetical protein
MVESIHREQLAVYSLEVIVRHWERAPCSTIGWAGEASTVLSEQAIDRPDICGRNSCT